jgi:Raf kinase inhibitor-like YbhB/YbcL family protein
MNMILRDALSTAMRASVVVFAVTLGLSGPANSQVTRASDGRFEIRSATFKNGTTLPLSMIDNIVVNGSNICSLGGSPGANQSPQLSWTNAPADTRTFVVIAFDTTASFTHWGIYNIAGDATGLPANAGVAASTYGSQVLNDFFDSGYDGPCPPTHVAPNVHHYVFTVYALASELDLEVPANFPANAETLFRALLQSAMHGDVLDSASITGFYSTTPAN